MHPILLKSILSLVIGIPVGILVIKLIFKTSVFATISIYWLADLLFVIMNTRIGDHFPDQYPYALVFFFNVAVSVALVYISYRFVSKPLNKSINGLKELAKGHLDFKISEERAARKDEIGELSRINKAVTTAFRQVISEINQGADKVTSVGKEVHSTSTSLSQAATNQAASLEEISGSMEQMMANIESNTENAIKTEDIAKQAHTAVQEGNNSALKALNSMKDISENIQIITDIAFQTNILALNAAVEAARAGEHGKGFAVVASEVRKLAERSKDAATRIEEMSNHGTIISQEAIELLNKTLPLIEKTTDHIQNISAASQEQRSGASQVNSAVQNINNSTQQNAKTAESMTSGSDELIDQANNLQEKVKYFRL